MRKLIVTLLILSVVFGMSACGKSEAAKAADGLINEIGEVTLQSEAAILAAEEAVGGLEQKDLESMDGIETLKKARSDYDALVDASKIAVVEDAINAIGTVTTDCENSIAAARAAYETLEDRLKSGVRNLDALAKAETDYEDAVLTEQAEVIEKTIDQIGNVTLQSKAKIEKAREEYNSYPAEVQAKVKNYEVLEASEQRLSELRVQRVETIINEIGEVTLESGSAISKANEALNELSSKEKSMVSNKDLLTSAEGTLKQLSREQLDIMLSKMKTMEDRINNYTYYFPSGWSFYGNYWAAGLSNFIRPYIGVGKNSFSVHSVYHYTGYDWVFWTKMTVVADGKKFTKSYKYRDITRDNSGGKVWEYYDDSLDLDMMRAIATSKETLVRFEGDTYYADYTVTAGEKQSIQEVLDAYELFLACGYTHR